ncbi:hypothetical protein DI53_1616 [Sphingobacterium deserti]|uniref:Uncharacterized protein n=1 Tax=Sphingobacterium deserti TaxID=1229276 RepID=A0A0B8T173_9SPHI|nr:hypothetical protein DI53_1616 [Sphingobacterium deserti]
MIKAKIGKCVDCSKESRLTAARCQYCYWKHRKDVKKSKIVDSGITIAKKQAKPIRFLSKKRAAQNVLYLKKRRIFMEQNNTCKARLSGCTYWSTDVHHPQGRMGGLLTDESKFIALCRNCHNFIEENPNFAKENGFSISRI